MNRIKTLRLENGWTQTDLAQKLSAVKSTISRYESEKAKLDPVTIARLCAIFHCSADYLLGLSPRRTAGVTEADAQLLRAYHAAPEPIRRIVDTALEDYADKKEPAAG